VSAVQLPAKIRPAMETGIPGAIVTCSPEGIPNATIISQIYWVDSQHVALSFQFFSKTIRNIRSNKQVCAMLFDPVELAHWILHIRFQQSMTEGPVFDEMDMQIEAIASMSGMSGIFKLKAADIYEVVSVEQIPCGQKSADR
jgi:hypothetical protein